MTSITKEPKSTTSTTKLSSASSTSTTTISASTSTLKNCGKISDMKTAGGFGGNYNLSTGGKINAKPDDKLKITAKMNQGITSSKLYGIRKNIWIK